MLQRAASNAYSWWRASHIRSRQSKWLDNNLEEMDDTVKKMLKLIEPDADSFGKRAELYFKRRPELIGFVEDAYRSYRALAERYDHISGELHKANHTISTCLPDQVHYAMLEDEDNIPRALTPINPSKINKETVQGLMNKKREKKSSKKGKKKHAAPRIDVETAREEINKLQKAILVLQTEKEFVKSSYESGIAKHWEIEKRIMEMQEEVSRLQDEFNTSAVIEDDEARSLMTATVLKSCEDTIAKLQEQRKKSLERAKKESERTKIAKEKMKALKCENFETGIENTDLSEGNMSLSPQNIEEEYSSLHKARTELQSLSEKIKEHFEKNPESSVLEIAEKIEEFANKVITMELTVSSHTLQINRLTSENDELEKYVKSMEEEKSLLADGSNELSEKLKEVVEELRRIEAIESIAQNEDINFLNNLSETWDSLNGISVVMHPQISLEYACIGDASQEDDVSLFDSEAQEDCKGKQATEIHEIKEDSVYAIHTTQELGYSGDPCLTDSSALAESGNEFSTADPSIHDTRNEEIALDGKEDNLKLQQLQGGEMILLTEYKSLLQNYEDTKRKLSEVEKKNEEYLQEVAALIEELKNDIALKDEEIRLLRQSIVSERKSSNDSLTPDTKRKLSEAEKKNEEYLQETAALIEELKNDIAMKDEEIRLLRQPIVSEKKSSNDSLTPNTKRKLSEVEKKNEEYLQEATALIEELKNDIAMKDEEIRLLRQPIVSEKKSSNDSLTPDTKGKLPEAEKKNEKYLQEAAALIEELKNDIVMKEEEIRLLRQPVVSKKKSFNDSFTPDTLTFEESLDTLTSKECSLELHKPISTSNSSTVKKNFSQGPDTLTSEEFSDTFTFEECSLDLQKPVSTSNSSRMKKNFYRQGPNTPTSEEYSLDPQKPVSTSNSSRAKKKYSRQGPDTLTSEEFLDTLTTEEHSLDPQKPLSTSNSSTAKKNFSRQGPRRTKHLIVEKAPSKRNSSVVLTKTQSSLAKDSGIQSMNDAVIGSPIGKKFRKEIDALLDEKLEFWLRFSTSFHNIQAYKDKYEDIQTEITRLKDNSQECDGNVTSDQFGKREPTRITTKLRQLKTELQVWLEQGGLLREDLQNRFSSLCDMQEEINTALNTTSDSGSALFTPCEAARFQGEVMSMKQENNKVVRELQAGLDQVEELHSEIERELSLLIGNTGPLAPKSSPDDIVEYAPNRANVPLRDFLFGVKPKKPSVLSLIQQSKLKCVRRKID